MSKTIRLMFVVMMSLFVVSMFSIKADGKDLVVPIEEASIRTASLEVKQGLRFYAKLDESVKNNEHGFYLIFGETTVEILAAAILGAVDGEIFVNGKIVFKVPISGTNQNNEYSVVLTGIPEKGYVDELSAIPYVIKDDAEKLPEALVKRSVLEVATTAYNNGESNLSLTNILNYAEANTKMMSLTANKLMVSAFDSSKLGNYKVYNIGDKVALPIALEKDGYEFLYYENDEQMYAAGDLVTVGEVDVDYNLVYSVLIYSILYNDSWQDEFEFIDNFYFDFYNWLLTRDGKDGVVVADNEVEMAVDGLTATAASFEELRDSIPETFAKTFGTLIYQPFVRADNNPVIPEANNDYFLNCDSFRKKYENLDGYFLNAILASFPLYDKSYNPDSGGSVEIFLAFQEWQQGSAIEAFLDVPKEYTDNGGNPATYTIESATFNLAENSIAKVGYTFGGWYDQKIGGNKITSISKGTFGNKVLYARWTVKEYTITFNSDGGSEVASMYVNYNSMINAPTDPTKEGYTFLHWDKEIPERMPAKNIEVTAVWAKIENDYYFGKYPQTVVDDANLITELNKLTQTNSNGYYELDGNEYAKLSANPYSTGYTFSNGETIVKNKIYYFKVEPIKWLILQQADGTLTLLTDMILDQQEFYTLSSIRTIDGETIYPNNYEHSTIREWLNNDFYNKAFNNINKEMILTTFVDNSASTTISSSNQYACNNTNDKVYLLSYQEAFNIYFSSDSQRQAITSDYARAQYIYVYNNFSYWWLRSPCDWYQYFADNVLDFGTFHTYFVYRNSVTYTYYGVRPTLKIKID